MKHGVWMRRIIDFLACMVMISVLYPFMSMVLSMLRQGYGVDIWQGMGLCASCCAVGYCVREWVDTREWTVFLVGFIKTMAGVLCVAAVGYLAFFRMEMRLAVQVVTVILALVGYLFGVKLHTVKNMVLNYCIIAALYLVSVIIAGNRNGFDSGILMWMFLGMSIIVAFAMNYNNIDRMMTRRGHSTANLPRRIRYFNLILLSILLVMVIVLFSLRGPLGNLLSPVGEWIGDGFTKLVQAFSSSVNSGKTPDVEQAPSSSGSGGDGGMGPMEEGNSTWITIMRWILGLVVGPALGVGLVIFVLIPMWGGIRDFFRELLFKIRTWLMRQRIVKTKTRLLSEEYTDIEEAVDLKGETENVAPETALRRWKRKLKKFAALPEGEEKFRRGYQLSLEGLEIHGVEIEPSMTPDEILLLASDTLPGEDYQAVTSCLDEMLYSIHEPEPQSHALEESLGTLRAKKLRRKEKEKV